MAISNYQLTSAQWCVSSPVIQLFVQQLVQAENKENIKAAHQGSVNNSDLRHKCNVYIKAIAV